MKKDKEPMEYPEPDYAEPQPEDPKDTEIRKLKEDLSDLNADFENHKARETNKDERIREQDESIVHLTKMLEVKEGEINDLQRQQNDLIRRLESKESQLDASLMISKRIAAQAEGLEEAYSQILQEIRGNGR